MTATVVPLRILPPEPVCQDQIELIGMIREVLTLACEGSLHSLSLVYTCNDNPVTVTRWHTFDGALADIISAVGKLHYELISAEE